VTFEPLEEARHSALRATVRALTLNGRRPPHSTIYTCAKKSTLSPFVAQDRHPSCPLFSTACGPAPGFRRPMFRLHGAHENVNPKAQLFGSRFGMLTFRTRAGGSPLVEALSVRTMS
jgi:hypothetical protein